MKRAGAFHFGVFDEMKSHRESASGGRETNNDRRTGLGGARVAVMGGK